MRNVESRRRSRGWTPLTVLLVTILVAACDTGAAPTGSAGTASPATTPSTTIAPTAELPSPVVTPSPVTSPTAASATTAGLRRGDLAVTVTPGLRVRSLPEVASDSIRYDPLLPLGSQLVVVDGPVVASGYTWYRVAPLDVKLKGGIGRGWVAIADHDGTPWIAAATDPTPGYELASAQVDRAPASVGAARTEATAVDAFGLALYRRMLADPSLGLATRGVVFSPYSVASALAMARAGANGPTADEMDALLRTRGWDSLGTGMGALDRLLASRDGAWADQGGTLHELSLRTANIAFAQRGLKLQPTFLERLSRTFGAGVGLVDYINDAEAARNAINGWANRQTLGRIPSVVGPADITTDTRIALVNAIYMKANWALAFPASDTTPRSFTRLDGSHVTTPTMTLYGDQGIVLARGTGWKASELRYAGANGEPLAMTLVLPDNLRTFESGLTPAVLTTIQARIAAETRRLSTVTHGAAGAEMDCGTIPYAVQLYLPRFGIDTRADLLAPLQTMGLRLATSAAADFSGMTTEAPLAIGTVIHVANIDVDETGTEAAAVTVVGMDTTGGCGGPEPAKVVTLRFDRPFLFLIRDVQTGAILFMGRVVDPTTR